MPWALRFFRVHPSARLVTDQRGGGGADRGGPGERVLQGPIDDRDVPFRSMATARTAQTAFAGARMRGDDLAAMEHLDAMGG